MARKTMDCRTMPSEKNCTVLISGEEDEVLELAAAHAVAAHGHADGADLRDALRGALREETELHAETGSFVQLIEFRTPDVDRVRELAEQWRAAIGREATARWGIVGADRNRPGSYVEVVAFPDHASAMRNSEHPATGDFAKRMQEITEGEAVFRDLDVVEVLRM
ncbi:DUF1059 domain-containing protein [Trujillonella humicola]|uniref:DUF1059 domain-containing protein n=1 Tax=Trujillonella humicola TaxID=3383699 RepID=UPI00390649B6